MHARPPPRSAIDVTLVGSNSLFHLPQDRWRYAIDTNVLTRVAAAAAALVVLTC